MKHLCTLLFISFTRLMFAGWVDMNTGINDHLTGVGMWYNYGILSGHKGFYYTTASGSAWTRFNITNNFSDSLIYNHCKFTDAYAPAADVGGEYTLFACGTDTINNRAVIISLSIPSLSYTIIYHGAIGTSLRGMAPHGTYAVGENGLIVLYNYTSSGIVNTPITADLNSIYVTPGSYLCIGADGAFMTGTAASTSSFTVTNTISAPGIDYKGVFCIGNNMGLGVATDNYDFYFSGYLNNNPYYDYGPLHGRCIAELPGMGYFVGTDHGIFYSVNSSYLEWQPTSLTYKINKIWVHTGFSATYACGDDGALLFTSDGGGTPKPVAFIATTGGCLGLATQIDGGTGSSTSCQWYIDNALVTSTCLISFGHTFTTVGSHTVQLNVSNGPGSYDTAVAIINIVDPPQINKPVSINDPILCHSEPVIISVDQSEPNVFYILQRTGDSSGWGSSPPGNGSTISFTSDSLSVSGNYYLVAQSTLATCARNFTNTFYIDVEKTKANFHIDKMNVIPGESLTAYQHCVDAQNYDWTFSLNATPLTSNQADPSFFFGSTGTAQVKLICWSNNGCYDSLETNHPAVYLEPNPDDSCWTMINHSRRPLGDFENITSLSPAKGGFLTTGYFDEVKFASRYGDSLQALVKKGGYLVKTNSHGIAKWMVYSRLDPDPANGGTRYWTNATAEDSQGNIYLTGAFNGPFFDNKGDTILIAPVPDYTFGLIKLDSMGKFIWALTGKYWTPIGISIDHSDNVIMRTTLNTSVASSVFNLNGTPTYTITNNATPANNFSLMKIASNGSIQWHAPIYIQYTNSSTLTKTGTDQYNNIYLTGFYENSARLFSAGSNWVNYLNSSIGSGGATTFLAKYDSNGLLLWKLRSFTPVTNSITAPGDMITDSAGNCYISGRNGCYNSLSPGQIVQNTNNTTSTLNAGGYFVTKINSSGVCQWMNGTTFTSTSSSYRMSKRGNEISVMGVLTGAAQVPVSSAFTSTDSNIIPLTLNYSDYFITVYDTAGVLLRTHINGNNSAILATYGYPGMIQKQDGAYYLAKDFSFDSNGGTHYDNFGTTIYPDSTIYGTITKFSGTCGNTLFPTANPVDLREMDVLAAISIYPNPNEGAFIIENNTGELTDIKLHDCLGKLIYAQSFQNKTNHINIVGVPKGIYLATIKTNDRIFIKKIVID